MSTYRAAVAQHKTKGKREAKDPEEIVTDNLSSYRTIAENAKLDGAQIIVYPEFGLFGLYKKYIFVTASPTDTKDLIRPFSVEIGEVGCDLLSGGGDHDGTACDTQLYTLADIAKTVGIVVVANVSEIIHPNSSSTNDDEERIYNTEVAISENGILLAKYHKLNPAYRKTFDTPDEEVVAFETSFGVRFGLFICKDIFHDQPQEALLSSEPKVKHFAFSVAMPSFLSGSIFSNWAKKNDAVLLASNLGTKGSGIFCGVSGRKVGDEKVSVDGSYVVVDVTK